MKKIFVLFLCFSMLFVVTACNVENKPVETLADGNYRYYYETDNYVTLTQSKPVKKTDFSAELLEIINSEEIISITVDLSTELDVDKTTYTLTNPANAEIVYNGADGLSVGKTKSGFYVITFHKSVFDSVQSNVSLKSEWKNYRVAFRLIDTEDHQLVIPRTELEKVLTL